MSTRWVNYVATHDQHPDAGAEAAVSRVGEIPLHLPSRYSKLPPLASCGDVGECDEILLAEAEDELRVVRHAERSVADRQTA
jgi:hypothetical protein